MVVHRICARLFRDVQALRLLRHLLPKPKDIVDEAMTEKEDGIETDGIILAHIAIRNLDIVPRLARDLKPADRQMYVVVRAFKR